MEKKYLIVTPVRDESQYLEHSINCILNQTILPAKWIIVNDNSKDDTLLIIEKYETKHPFIKIKNITNNFERIPGANVMKAFEFGLENENVNQYDFIVKFDADLDIKSNFFENIFKYFELNPNLGIASGLVLEKNGKPTSKNYPDHTYGNTKIYSSKCFNDILPIEKFKYWDLIDNIKANLEGYETKIIYSEIVYHLKPMDSAVGYKKEAKLKGYYSSYLRYNELFLILKTVKIIFEKPFFLKGLYYLIGYLENILIKKDFYSNIKVVKYLREQQKNRLLLYFNKIIKVKNDKY